MRESFWVSVESASGDEHVGARSGCPGDGARSDTTIDFEVDVIGSAGPFDHLADSSDLGFHGRDVGLSSEARVHGHDEDQVDEI